METDCNETTNAVMSKICFIGTACVMNNVVGGSS